MTTLELNNQDSIVSELDNTPTTEDIKVAGEGFIKLNLSENILKAISDLNYLQPSGIQAAAIPQIIQGIDIIAKAPTGSGKTAAFAIPMLEKLDLNPQNKDVQALVLCPTRELVMQVHREFEKLCKYQDGVSVVSVYGGQQIDKQFNALRKNPQIVVATPGRLMDHLRRGSINLNAINMVVLDEADEMLDMGFRDDIHTILEDTPEHRQTVLFSATMAKDIVAITKKFQKSPNIIDVTDNLQSTPDIEQLYFEVVEKDKVELLTRLLDLHNVKLALVFCNTKSNVDKVVEILKTRGYFADALHGDMNQTQREKVMRGFRNGGVEILVATDVAGRGIDVKNVEAVFNYDLPRDDEDYIHRIGRTARAGESGTAFTFVSRNQVQSIRRIERANGVLINKREAPTFEALEAARTTTYEKQIKTIIKNDDLTAYIARIEAMLNENVSVMEVAATLLKLSMNKESKKINKNVVFEQSVGDEDGRSSRRRRGGFGGGNRGSRGGFGGNRDSRESRGSRDSREPRSGFGGGRDFDRAPRDRNRSFGKRTNENHGERANNNSPREALTLNEMIQSVKSIEAPKKRFGERNGKSKSGGFGSYGKKSGSKNKNKSSFSK